MVIAERTGVVTSKKLRYLLDVHILDELLRRISTDNLNFLTRVLVEPPLNNWPYCRKSPRSIHYHGQSKLLWIIILRYHCILLNNGVYPAIHLAHCEACQVQNRECVEYLLLAYEWACHVVTFDDHFHCLDAVFPEKFFGNNFKNFVWLDLTAALYVYRPSK